MKTNEELKLMYDLEIAINGLTRYMEKKLGSEEKNEKWHNCYAAYDLCKGLTYAKIAISRLLDL